MRDLGTWEWWLAFFLRGVIEVSEQAADTVRRVLSLREAHRGEITDRFGRATSNGNRVLEYIYKFPVVSVSDVQEKIGTSYTAANNLVGRMVDCGILHQFNGETRNRQFGFQDYIDLFQDSRPSPARDRLTRTMGSSPSATIRNNFAVQGVRALQA